MEAKSSSLASVSRRHHFSPHGIGLRGWSNWSISAKPTSQIFRPGASVWIRILGHYGILEDTLPKCETKGDEPIFRFDGSCYDVLSGSVSNVPKSLGEDGISF